MEWGVFVKDVIGSLLMPLPICLLAIVLGLYFFITKQSKFGGRLCQLGCLLLLVFSLPFTSRFIIQPIEFEYPKLPLNDPNYIANLKPEFVVVMGCWHSDDTQLPLVAQIHQCSLARVVQAVQIWHQFPATTLVFSGYAGRNGKKSDPAINSELAKALGVDKNNIKLIEGTRDSYEEVIEHKKLILNSTFIVVSSATHMKRLAFIYQSLNMSPVLSPAEYVSSHEPFTWRMLVPSSSGLHQSERAIYELLGNTWVRLLSIFRSDVTLTGQTNNSEPNAS